MFLHSFGQRFQYLFLCVLVAGVISPSVVTPTPIPAATAPTPASQNVPPPVALVYYPEFQRAMFFDGSSNPNATPILWSLDLSKPFSFSTPPPRMPLPAAHQLLALQTQSAFVVPWTGPNNEFALLGNDHATMGRLASGETGVEGVSALGGWSPSASNKFGERPSYSMAATASPGVGIVDSKTYIFGRESELLVFDSVRFAMFQYSNFYGIQAQASCLQDKTLKPVSPASPARPPPRQSASLIRIDSIRLLLSGGSSDDTANTPLADNWVFDLTTSTWTQIASFALGPRHSHQTIVVRPVATSGSQSYVVLVGGQGAWSALEYSAIPAPGSNAWVWKPVQPISNLSPIPSPVPLLAIQDQLLIFTANSTLTALKLAEPTPGTLTFTPLDSYTPPPTSSPSILEQTSGPVSATTMIIVAGVCVGIIGLVFVLGIAWYQRQHPHDPAPLTGMFRAHDGDTLLGVSLEPLALPRQPPGSGGARRARARTNSLPVQPVPTAWALPPKRRTISTGRKVTFQLPHAHSEPDLHVPRSPSGSVSWASPASLSASVPMLSRPEVVVGEEVRQGQQPRIGPELALKYPAAAAVADAGAELLMDQEMAASAPLVGRKCKRSVSWHASTGVHGREESGAGRPVLHASDVQESLLDEPLLVRRASSPTVAPPAEDRDAPEC